MVITKAISYVLDKIRFRDNSDPLKNFDAKKALARGITLITKLFKYQGINFRKIDDINTIGGGDYTEAFSNILETSVINQNYVQNVFEGDITWNGDHLHLNLVRVDDTDYYIAAIWHPFELYANPGMLWVYKLNKEETMFWNNIIQPKA